MNYQIGKQKITEDKLKKMSGNDANALYYATHQGNKQANTMFTNPGSYVDTGEQEKATKEDYENVLRQIRQIHKNMNEPKREIPRLNKPVEKNTSNNTNTVAQSTETPDLGQYGKFNSVDEADEYAEKLHNQQEDLYAQSAPESKYKRLDYYTRKELEEESKNIRARGMGMTEVDKQRVKAINKLIKEDDRAKYKEKYEGKTFLDKALDPTYQMSKEEEKHAASILNDYYEKNPNAKTLLHANNPNLARKTRESMTESEYKEYQKMAALYNKISDASAFTYGLMNIMPFGNTIMDKLGEMTGVDNDYNYSTQKQNVKTQSPLAYLGGDMASKVAAYKVLGDALEQIPALNDFTNGLGYMASGGNATVGNVLGRIARGTMADIALDTIPTEVENYKNGMNPADIASDATQNILINTAINGAAEAVPYLINRVKGGASPSISTSGNANKNITNLESIKDNANLPTDDITLAKRRYDLGQSDEYTFTNLIENDAVKLLNKDGMIDDILSKHPNIKRHIENETKTTDEIESEMQSFYKQARDYLGDKFNSYDLFDCGITPSALKENGVKGNRIMMTQKIFDKLSNPPETYKGGHGLGVDGVEKVIRGLNNPALIMGDKGDVLAVIDYSSKSGKPVYVILTVGDNGTIKDVNDVLDSSKVKSAYINRALSKIISDNDSEISYIRQGDVIPDIDLQERLVGNTSPSDLNVNPNGDVVNPKVTPENVVYHSDVPSKNNKVEERGLSKHIRGEGAMKMEGVSDEVVSDFVDDPAMYKVLSNAETKNIADEVYNSGDAPITIKGKEYTGDVETKFRTMLAEHNPSALPLGHQLAKDYSASGNPEMAAQIYRDMGEQLTKSGQFSQAAILTMMKDDPMTALRYAENEIDSLNRAGRQQFGNSWNDLSLTNDEIDAFNNINPGDEKAIKELYDSIGARLGKEYPTTFMEKLIEGRKVAMLFNMRTMVRNVLANPPTLGMRWASDRLEALGQNIVHIIDPSYKPTQSIVGSGINGRKLASQVAQSDTYKNLINGTSGKYEVPDIKNSLMTNKQMFKGTAMSKFINKFTNGGIEKLNSTLFGKDGVESGLETIRNATYKLLDLGDSPFVKENFIERLGSYINAQGIKDINDIPPEAIETAWEAALKATYKDDSWAVQALRGIRNGIAKIPGVGKPLSQAAIPFLQAPANIGARMVDYSPINAGVGATNLVKGIAQKDHKLIEKGIEGISKGTTGAGMVYLGMKLRQAGVLTGDYAQNKRQKEMQKMDGFKPWSLKVGDKYFQYNWAQPFAENLIVGTLMQDAIDNSDEYDSDILKYFGIENSELGKKGGALYKGSKAAVQSWVDETPIQNILEMFGANSNNYGESDVAQSIIDKGAGDFAGALVPATVNAIAKTSDTTRRNAYDPSNSFASYVNQQKAKIPEVSKKLPAKYDLWGRESKYANSKGEAFLQRFIFPGEYGTETTDPIDVELTNLFKSTNKESVFPTYAPSKVGETKLTNEQVSEYQKDVGQRNRQIVEDFIGSNYYKSLSNDNKAEALSTLYGASKTITERDKFNAKVPDNSKYKAYLEAYDDAGGGEAGAKAMAELAYAKSLGASNNDATKKVMATDDGIKNLKRLSAYDNQTDWLNELKSMGLTTTENANYIKAIKGDDIAKEAGTTDQEIVDYYFGKAQSNTEKAQTKAANATDYEVLEQYGYTSEKAQNAYDKAKKSIPSLTPQEFSSQFKAIDTGSKNNPNKPNETISQDEVIAYLNKGNYSQAEANKIWKAYGNNWKKVPVLEKNKWKAK